MNMDCYLLVTLLLVPFTPFRREFWNPSLRHDGSQFLCIMWVKLFPLCQRGMLSSSPLKKWTYIFPFYSVALSF